MMLSVKSPAPFAGAMRGIDAMKAVGMEFQINTTITSANLHELKDIHYLALELGAAAHHIFLLVPTGRGKDLAGQVITRRRLRRNTAVVLSGKSDV